MNTFFPSKQYPHLEIIGEPGRYMATSYSTLYLSIQGKREETVNGKKHFKYYCDDGVYGSFNCIMFDHAKPHPIVFHTTNMNHSQEYPTTLFGPTCDSLDCIVKNIPFQECNIGDILMFQNMGAYTLAAASTFNGMKKAVSTYIRTPVEE